MLLDIRTWIYSKLNANTTLANKGVYYYPNDLTIVPVWAYRESQRETVQDFFDDTAKAQDVVIDIDVFTPMDTDNQSYLDAVAAVMSGLKFTLDLCQPFAEPETKLMHHTLSYSRQGVTQEDLV